MIPRILGALLLCLACAAQAGVYTYIDAEGNRVYTDQPPPAGARPNASNWRRATAWRRRAYAIVRPPRRWR